MAKNNKYQINLQQVDSSWQAQVTRQVTSKKTTVTKQQENFTSEADAKEWADAELNKLLETQVSNNQRQNKNRKEKAEIVEQRSSRRAEKTAQAKAEKVEKEKVASEQKNSPQFNTELTAEIDSEVDYDFNESSE